MGKIAQFVMIGLLVVHCSNGSRQSTRNTPAPQSAEDLGYIVMAQPQEIAAIEKAEPNAGIRVLSSADGLYEINHIEASQLIGYLSNKNLQKNFFMKRNEVAPSRLSMNKLAFNTSPDALKALQSCQRSAKAPSIDIDLERSSFKTKITLGESVTIAAKGDANAEIGGDVRFMWDMVAPQFSKQGIEKGITDVQTFTPDSVGVYQVALIGQGIDSSCNGLILQIQVTANPELDSTLSMNETPSASIFKHLDQIKAREAQNLARGKGAIVAVVDSGINYNHPSLRNKIETKTVEEEKADGNTYAADSMGWDFINSDNKPFDDNGHGSHVSGLIASDLAGVAPDSKIIPVKVLDAAGEGDLGTIVAGILYAVNSKAQIINLSLGFEVPFTPQPMAFALSIARAKGKTVFIAAGNGDEMTGLGYDIALRPNQPANVQLENTITVAATAEGALSSFSNFSEKLVQIAAPGGDENEPIFSMATMNPENRGLAGEMGTSMAAPVAAGVAALLLSANPQLQPAQIKSILMDTGDEISSLKGKVASGKQVNALAAVQKALDLNPAASMN